MSLDIITIGESLIELSSEKRISESETFGKFYGGDTLCTAVAAARLGSEVGYITRVGNDHFKDFLLDNWQSVGLDISNVKLVDGYNGIYFIAHPEGQEKEYAYYRKKTAACNLSIDDISEEYIKSAKIFYTSGVAQSISLSAREAIRKAYSIAKENSVITAYDPNFTSKIWSNSDAFDAMNELIEYLDIVFLSLENDVTPITELTSPEAVINELWDRGVNTIIVKSGAEKGYYVGSGGTKFFTKYYTDKVVDTTSAGDVFNGAYLHCITHGQTCVNATKYAAIMSGLQAQNIGAIKSIPTKAEVVEKYKEWHD